MKIATAPRYRVGIDLGTTHTVVAYAEITRGKSVPDIQVFPIEQLVAPGEVAARPLLPSLRYHPLREELAPGDTQLPWPQTDQAVLGTLAQELGAKSPGRLVASAKSWLSHTAVDRSAPILPWGGAEDVPKISPLDASAGYLAHVRAAWKQHFPKHPLEHQDVVLTLPASFDEAARALTIEAARLAGLPGVRLLEEPQAACYDWLYRHRDELSALGDSRLLLVCDVGGGTTDLTLIQIGPGPQLTRIGVGDHLMLGGDNMDLAIAQLAEPRLLAAGAQLSSARLAQLMQQCRLAKECLLSEHAPETAKITLLGAGARLVGAARSTELAGNEIQDLVLDGFFPQVSPDAKPQKRRGAIVEFGLPYTADPAISRHLAAFLAQHAQVCRQALGEPDALAIPDAVLLNGGVFHSGALSRRLLDILSDWRGAPLTALQNQEPDLAVARGAVAYALARQGQGLRIGGGSARSYFLLLDGTDKQGVCLLPKGTEEGQEIRLQDRRFLLRLGQPVRFHLASSTADTLYSPGELATLDPTVFTPLPPIATVLSTEDQEQSREAPVQLACALTEVGTLAVSCVSAENQRRWQLEFQLRGNSATAARHPRFQDAAALLQRPYGSRSARVDPKSVKTLRVDLEKVLGKREHWDPALLRELFSVLWEGRRRRRRSIDHERLWLNLTGYCLRPGFGYPLDEWRVEQLWSLYEQGIQYVGETQNWAEWWTLWRRLAGGLQPSHQERILGDIAYELQLPSGKGQKRKGPKKQGYADMVRLVGTLEQLPAVRKVEVGGWLLERLQTKGESPQTWWAVGRLGARVPLYGSAHHVVPREVVLEWLEQVLALNWKNVQPAAFAAAMLARLSGDRERDLDRSARERVAQRLRAAKAPASWVSMVQEVIQLNAADEQRVFGESLPPGLRLAE